MGASSLVNDRYCLLGIPHDQIGDGLAEVPEDLAAVPKSQNLLVQKEKWRVSRSKGIRYQFHRWWCPIGKLPRLGDRPSLDTTMGQAHFLLFFCPSLAPCFPGEVATSLKVTLGSHHWGHAGFVSAWNHGVTSPKAQRHSPPEAWWS